MQRNVYRLDRVGATHRTNKLFRGTLSSQLDAWPRPTCPPGRATE